ncbi:hypothetical protein PPERSA_01170 [Pseudocohnilembus persalinus]|uniref:Uncharacterized protein n=1 Tax=Pseudocohnilembus persalinus TaxID=266149 RepID=A0A0V0R1U3_PSEPJ|nr:hypothetical protein PPERSA_01170 [Pseudocohnilembus persalinus]|eukprot:KRX08240.1 hypothetical protein PPERSA_01170 [Pseudocohnilembus persalinus]
MGAFQRQLGRILFVAYFVFIAYNLMRNKQAQDAYANQIQQSYPKFHNWVMEDLGFKQHIGHLLPEQLSVEFIKAQAPQIAQYQIYFLYTVSGLIFLTIPGAGLLLNLYQWAVVLVVHNPLLQETEKDQYETLQKALVDIALAGGALLMCCGSSCSKNSCPVSKKPTVKTSTTGKKPQPSKRGGRTSR